MEIFITIVIVIFAVYIIVKSLKNSSEGKCNGGCSKCNAKSKCSGNTDEKSK